MGVRKYKLGIIGFGSMATQHLQCHSNNKTNVEVKGVFDLDKKRNDAAIEYGLHVYESREALLSDPEIDIVLVATTNEVHKEIAIESLRAGKHTIVEKPVTLSSDELEEIIKVRDETGLVFTINQNRRTNKDFNLMKRNVQNNSLGDVYVIESRVEGSRGMPKGWRTIKNLGGGMMLDWGVHLIDQILYMYQGCKVTNVYCKMFSIEYTQVDDNFRLNFTLDNGVLVNIEVSTNNYINNPRWYVLGKDGTLRITGWDCEGEIVRCIHKDDTWEEEVIYTKAGPTKTMAPRRPESVERIKLSEPMDIEDGIHVVYEQLTGAIEGKDLTITAEQALRVMKVMEAAFLSHQTNSSIATNI